MIFSIFSNSLSPLSLISCPTEVVTVSSESYGAISVVFSNLLRWSILMELTILRMPWLVLFVFFLVKSSDEFPEIIWIFISQPTPSSRHLRKNLSESWFDAFKATFKSIKSLTIRENTELHQLSLFNRFFPHTAYVHKIVLNSKWCFETPDQFLNIGVKITLDLIF